MGKYCILILVHFVYPRNQIYPANTIRSKTLEKTTDASFSVKDRVYDELKQRIITLELSPGEPLKEQELATHFEVSRTPVREALGILDHEGLVEIIPQKGAFVAKLDFMIIREIYQLREVLEGLAARIAAPRIDIRKLDKIEKILDSSEDAAQIERKGRELHEFIIKAAGNRRLAEILRILQSQVMRIHYLTVRIPGRTEKSLQEHREIIAALRKRKGNLAERTVKRHIMSSMESTLRAIARSS